MRDRLMHLTTTIRIGRLVSLAAAFALFPALVRDVTADSAAKSDSGWTVGSPSAIATGSADPEQQVILQHVLEQGHTPLLKNRQPAPQDGSTFAPADGLRFAVRPDGIDGWRPPTSILSSGGGQWQAATGSGNASSQAAHDVAPLTPRLENESEAAAPSASDSSVAVGEKPPAVEPEDVLPVADSGDQHVESEVESGDESERSVAEAGEGAPLVQSVQPPPLTKQLLSLRSRVRSVLKNYYRKMLNSREHDPWEVMHGMLAYGVHSNIRQGGARGAPITSVGWLCYNKPCKGQTLLYVTPQGELRAKYGVGLQGHLGQFLAMLAQCRVSEEYPIRVGKNEFTIRDLIEAEKKTCYPKSELTFKLIALQHYLDLSERWVNDQGLEWDIPRLIREELAQPIRGAACGGTHRLSGLSLAVKARVRRGEPLDGEYARAAEFVERYHHYAFRLQNRDGSLSTAWFNGRGDDPDINRRIKTTGHILEWLCYSLREDDLRDERTIRAVSYLANLMYYKYDNEWEVGPMSHAIHALLLYDERVFQPYDSDSLELAYKPRPRTARRDRASASRR